MVVPSFQSWPLTPTLYLKWRGRFSEKFRRETTVIEKKSIGQNNRGEPSSGSNEIPALSSVECYACTQEGVPVFHSTSGDQAHPPKWLASAGSSLVPIQDGSEPNPIWTFHKRLKSPFGDVLDPRSKRVQIWTRLFLLARAMALAVDPLFFYALSIGETIVPAYLYIDRVFLVVVTVLRTCPDAFHLLHVWLQFRLAYVSKESLVIGNGKLVWDSRAIALHYTSSLSGFWFDLMVILPVPQFVFWSVVPKLIREEKIELLMRILLLMFLFQFPLKIYHCFSLMRRMKKATGYIFGTIWWGFALSLITYFMASHVCGGCWYVLAIHRVASCIRQQCSLSGNLTDVVNTCLNPDGPVQYGIYIPALSVLSKNSLAVKILYPIFWGLLTFSTIGNTLEPTSKLDEVIFSTFLVVGGLLLFTFMIGNIQVFTHLVIARKRKMQLRCRDMEWWMKRRQLPSRLRRRVQRFERQRDIAFGGDDEFDLIQDLPPGLRRDIKRYLCSDLINKVPLFKGMDDLILDNICDRAKPQVFSKDEKIIREGDPIQRMIFIIRGQAKRSQGLSKGVVATSTVEPGGYLGDELLWWSLRRPFNDRLPSSSATFVCVDNIEAFSLNSDDLRYITVHFRYKFAEERLKWTARYYSSNWRTWAAVNIQMTWRRYKRRIARDKSGSDSIIPVRSGESSSLLLAYAWIFMSIRPHDHLE